MNTDRVVTYSTRKAVSQAAPVNAISSLGISRVLFGEKKRQQLKSLIFYVCAVRGSTQAVARAYSIGDRSKEEDGGIRVGGRRVPIRNNKKLTLGVSPWGKYCGARNGLNVYFVSF